MQEKGTYFNFPIQLLKGFMENSKTVLDNISDYAIYAHCRKLEFGNKTEKIKASAEYFNITIGSKTKCYSNGSDLYYEYISNTVKVGIKLTIFWDYYENIKTEFQKICLLGFLGLKSIVQNKPYCKTNNKLWLARMNGDLKHNKQSLFSPSIEKYNNEYQTVKIKTELELNWYLVQYGYQIRGFYISFQLTIEKLAIEVEQQRKSLKTKALNERKKQARIAAIELVKKSRP